MQLQSKTEERKQEKKKSSSSNNINNNNKKEEEIKEDIQLDEYDGKNNNTNFKSYYSKTEVNYPTSIKDLMSDFWRVRIYQRIKKFNLHDTLNSEEDIFQDILLSLCESDYISRYNPDKHRSFEVYLFVFIDNLLKRKYKKENSVNGKNIVCRASLEPFSLEGDNKPEKGVIYLESLNLEVGGVYEDLEFQELVEGIKDELKSYKASSSVLYNNKVIQRDPSTLFDFLLQDKSISEISTIFNTSKQFIYILLKKIRNTKLASDLHSEFFNC